MKFSAAVILAAAIGASAYPGHHSHRHAHRAAVQGREFVMAKKPAPPAPTTTSTPPPPATSTATPTPSSAPPPVANAAAAVDTSSTSSSASASSSAGAGGFEPFCVGKKAKRVTEAQVFYTGNTGVAGNYGCNIKEVSANSVSHYDYSMTFTNKVGSDQECCCWNKIGPDGKLTGMFLQNVAMKFSLPAGGKSYVAVDKNSQVACACGTGSIPVTPYGQVASTWVEADFGNESNQKWSGCDASALVSAKYGLNIPPLSCCHNGQCSTIYQGGRGDNAYEGGMEAEDGVGLNIIAGPVHLDVTIG